MLKSSKECDYSLFKTGARHTRDELGEWKVVDGTKYGQHGVSTKVWFREVKAGFG